MFHNFVINLYVNYVVIYIKEKHLEGKLMFSFLHKFTIQIYIYI